MFFIECDSAVKSLDISLELISVMFNRPCRLSEKQIAHSEKVYTIISLKTSNTDTQQYFLEIVCIILGQMPPIPTHRQLKVEIQKLIELFSRFTRPPRCTIQGLWAEMLIIEQATDPTYLIQSWHTTPQDKFDFNDGQDKIEVKSTAQVRRSHRFSFEQLTPSKNSQLLIASVFTIQTGHGKNIFDLQKSICRRVSDLQLQFRLNDILAQTLGSDLNKAFEIYFDYQHATDTLSFYNYKDIPVIQGGHIPNEISNLSFDCDLSEVPTISHNNASIWHSRLFKSLRVKL